MKMYRSFCCAVAVCFLALAAQAAEPSMPAGFKTASVQTADGATIHVRTGGKGPAVVLIHGFGDTGDMWGPLAARLARLYAQPGAMRASFAQFNTIATHDVADNRSASKVKLTMPVLAVGGEKSFGPMMATVMRNAALDVRQAVVPGAGHWMMEENPDATVKLIDDFLNADVAAR
ncbi:alpha/beta fold hydrolase [Massilia arenae]|uniref:Alpha/beta hydrolase n=1 Tax=Massilia arenae TaxID=2603288 RepID=A0A5C7G691_9BURK|nr:alpha/beta hydrolase [Massilia arenae]TXG01424.1 hypothetical protein FVD38_06145 [Massilia arenae]